MAALAVANRYIRYRVFDLSNYAVVKYWEDLLAANLLKDRLCDTLEPNLKDVKEMLTIKNNLCYIMWDTVNKKVCADTMLNNISGLVAQVHFSMHPDYFGPATVRIAKEGCEQHFNTAVGGPDYYISTLVGITPVTNRKAICFIRKVGFKQVCELENVLYLPNEDRYVNGCLSKLSVKELYNG